MADYSKPQNPTIRKPITQERLRELLHYDPLTGTFVWRKTMNGFVKAGRVAGKINEKGHRRIRIDYKAYYAARLAIFYVTGKWPSCYADHANRVPDDDRYENLRDATHAQNTANSKVSKVNLIGIKGVLKRGNRYRAQITANKKHYQLGTFDTPEAAHEAYMEAAIAAHGKFARG